MLVKALLPLHKARLIGPYHPQLSYCMALYVAKDHALTREVRGPRAQRVRARVCAG